MFKQRIFKSCIELSEDVFFYFLEFCKKFSFLYNFVSILIIRKAVMITFKNVIDLSIYSLFTISSNLTYQLFKWKKNLKFL